MSKEEILEQCGFPADYYKSVENMDMGKYSTTPLAPTLKAMDTYAQQESRVLAIGFATWAAWDWDIGFVDMGMNATWWNKKDSSISATTSELYVMFLSSKK